MTLELQTALDDISVLAVWSAITIYVLAFLSFAYDLSQRAVAAPEQRAVPELALAGAGVAGAGIAGSAAGAAGRAGSATGAPGRRARSGTATLPEPTLELPLSQRSRRLWARLGVALTLLGLLLQFVGTLTRGIAAGRVPWANMYEFALVGTLLIVAVYLVALLKYDLRFLGVFIVGMVSLFLGGSAVSFYVEVTPLMDPLKSVWLVVHVFVASLATAFFAIGAGLSTIQLAQAGREARAVASRGTVDRARPVRGYRQALPSADTLESLAYRFAVLGFIFWTFTLVAGAIWANESWGRYWGFDTKEVWTFIIWVLYAGYIHARATRGWRGSRSAWLSLVGFAAVIFNFVVVNVFFKGLHAYSGLT